MMCLWCGHSFESFYLGACDPGQDGRSCGCLITEAMQNAWKRWIEAEKPDRWVKNDWDYIMERYG